MRTTDKLSIVIGTYNRLNEIRRCVESITRETVTDYHLYVTDAGSTDGTIEYLNSIRSATITPLFIGERLGQARAYNDVFEKVPTPYVCWLSDDNAVVNAGLDVAIGILEREPRIGMVALKTRDIQGPFVHAPYIGGISDLGILNVNQGMLRTEVLRTVGGFSEAFRDYGIDPDLTAKVLFSGHDIVYTKAVALHHYRNWGVDKASPEYKKIREKNARAKQLYLEKYSGLIRASVFSGLKRNARGALSKTNFTSAASARRIAQSAFYRDFSNVLGCRFISVLDPVLSCGKTYHLRQRCPRGCLPATLPPDPEVQ